MSRTTIQGWAETKTLNSGKTVTEVSGNQAPRRKNPDTGEWEQVGDALYIRAAFWDEEAEYVARVAGGNRVTVEGELTAREFTRADGTAGVALELRWPRFLGVLPPRHGGQQQQVQPTPIQQAQQQQSDPWGQPGGPDMTAPF